MAELLDGKVAIVSGVGPGSAARSAQRCTSTVRNSWSATSTAVRSTAPSPRTAPSGRSTDITDVDACDALVDLALQDARPRRHPRERRVSRRRLHGVRGRRPRALARDVRRQRVGHAPDDAAVLPVMKEQGDGRVVMVLTQGVEWVLPTFGAYTSSKAALAHLVKLLATELGQYGIRVNGICPGPIFADALQGYLRHAGAGARRRRAGGVRRVGRADRAAVSRPARRGRRLGRVPRLRPRATGDGAGDLHRRRPVVPTDVGSTTVGCDATFAGIDDLWDLIEARADATPDALLAVDELDRTLTFGEYRARASSRPTRCATLGHRRRDGRVVAAADVARVARARRRARRASARCRTRSCRSVARARSASWSARPARSS